MEEFEGCRNFMRLDRKDWTPQRDDYEYNHNLVLYGYRQLILANGMKPTIAQVADYVGLGYSTVANHLKDLQWKPAEATQQILTDDVVFAMYKTAMGGDSASMRLWFQVINGINFSAGHAKEGANKEPMQVIVNIASNGQGDTMTYEEREEFESMGNAE